MSRLLPAALLCSLVGLVVSAPLLATDGGLRTSFETGGVFSYGTTSHLRSLFGAVTAPDGAVVVYGYYIEKTGDETTAAGLHWRRVTSSGVGSECNVEVPSSNYGWINDARFDNTGDLVAAGQVSMTSDSKWDFVVARFNYPACDLDEGFDGDGLRNFDFGGLDSQAFGIVPITFIVPSPVPPYVTIEFDLLVGGNVGANDLGIARLNSTGSFDTDFDFDGKAQFDLGSVDRAAGMVRGPSGALLLFGKSDAWEANNDDYFLAAVTPTTGAADNDFGAFGLQSYDSALGAFPDDFAADIVNTDEGRVYFTGTSIHDPNSDAYVAEVESDGDPHSGFSGDGVLAFSVFSGGGNSSTNGSALLVQSDDKILVAGGAAQASGFGPGFQATRLLPNGGFDSSFGTGGTVKHPLDILAGAGESFQVGGVASLEGRILVAGYAQAAGVNKEYVALLDNALIFADDFDSGSTGNW